jgi:hypothetical protein
MPLRISLLGRMLEAVYPQSGALNRQSLFATTSAWLSLLHDLLAGFEEDHDPYVKAKKNRSRVAPSDNSSRGRTHLPEGTGLAGRHSSLSQVRRLCADASATSLLPD